jgi:hypothetical protein
MQVAAHHTNTCLVLRHQFINGFAGDRGHDGDQVGFFRPILWIKHKSTLTVSLRFANLLHDGVRTICACTHPNGLIARIQHGVPSTGPVKLMRDMSLGADLLIFLVPSVRLITRAAAVSKIMGSGTGKNGVSKVLLNVVTTDCVNSRCCFWSSPTGTADVAKKRTEKYTTSAAVRLNGANSAHHYPQLCTEECPLPSTQDTKTSLTWQHCDLTLTFA